MPSYTLPRIHINEKDIKEARLYKQIVGLCNAGNMPISQKEDRNAGWSKKSKPLSVIIIKAY